jgi:ribonucleoside-diphosphate reductase alpha chain
MPLPPRGSCPSGTPNLTAFIRHPFSEQASFDKGELLKTTALAVRMLDNTIEATSYPYPELATYEYNTRRIGLGVTGLADCLIMLGIAYGEKRAIIFAEDIMKTICHQAYQTSAALAHEKGMFPWCQPALHVEGEFISRVVPDVICEEIARHGIRNSHLLMIAPNDEVATLANNLTPGIEPVFDVSYHKTLQKSDGSTEDFVFTDYAFHHWKKQFRRQSVPHQFVDAHMIDPFIHLEMQSTLQRYVDQSVGKEIRFPKGMSVTDIERVYSKAYEQGVKVVG